MDKIKRKKLSSRKLFIVGSSTGRGFPADYVMQTAKLLAKKNKVIIFYWGTALSLKEYFSQKKQFSLFETDENRNIIHFYPTHFLPFRRFYVVNNMNLFINVLTIKLLILLKGWNNYQKFAWNFYYGLYAFPKFLGNSWTSLYDCVEYPFSFDKKHNSKIRKEEEKIIQNSDYFFVDSPTLKEKWKKYKPKLVPQGFDLQTFERNKKVHSREISFNDKKPIVGYVGGINYRLDFRLIDKLVKENPQWNFIFVGPKQNSLIEDKYVRTHYWIRKISNYKNFIYIPCQPKEYMPVIINQFDACLIPYDVKNKFNYYSRAMKVYEYLYFCKPIISIPILESQRLHKVVLLARNSKEFSSAIKKALNRKVLKNDCKIKRDLCFENSWDKKIGEIMTYL